MVTFAAVAVAVALTLVGELLHARRGARFAARGFGPGGRPAPVAVAAPLLRPLAVGLLAWGFVTLAQLPPKIHRGEEVPPEEWRHLVLVFDVSPSMLLKDAGVGGDQTRVARARELLDSLFERVPLGKFKVTVIATYNGAKPVVEDTTDFEVVRHVLSEVDLRYAFKAGSTKLFDGIAEAARIAKPWRIGSTLLVIVSDGDTVPASGMPELPPSIGGSLVIGVGDHLAGKFIAGHQSRQDESTLRQVANRLGGEFHNGNKRHVPSDVLSVAAADSRKPLLQRLTLREYALIAICAATVLLAALPLLLAAFGSRLRVGVRLQPTAAA
ncbi:MAG: vWA domain-containing protein [Planctomycetota bacterium]